MNVIILKQTDSRGSAYPKGSVFAMICVDTGEDAGACLATFPTEGNAVHYCGMMNLTITDNEFNNKGE